MDRCAVEGRPIELRATDYEQSSPRRYLRPSTWIVRFGVGALSRWVSRGLPPCRLITTSVKGTMVDAAQGHRELIADPAPQGPGLHESQIMGVRRLPAAQHGCDATNSKWARSRKRRGSLSGRALLSTCQATTFCGRE
jgi:hypothetical protein